MFIKKRSKKSGDERCEEPFKAFFDKLTEETLSQKISWSPFPENHFKENGIPFDEKLDDGKSYYAEVSPGFIYLLYERTSPARTADRYSLYLRERERSCIARLRCDEASLYQLYFSIIENPDNERIPFVEMFTAKFVDSQ